MRFPPRANAWRRRATRFFRSGVRFGYHTGQAVRRRSWNLRHLTAVVALTVATGSCGDGGGGGTTTPAPPPPPPNRAPSVTVPIPSQSLTIGTSGMLNLAEHFSDPDADQLAFAATSSNTGVVSVSVSGSVLTLTPTREGDASISVTARDPRGSSAAQSFSVSVERPNEAPRATRGIRDQTLTDGGSDVNLDLDDHFSDPDDDRLEFTATSDSTSVVSVRVSGSNLRLSPRREGSATVDVVARDPGGLTASQSFDVTVEPAGPAFEIRPTGCPAEVLGSRVRFTLNGSILANRSATNVVVFGCVRPGTEPVNTCDSSSRYYIGRDSLGTMDRGESKRYEISGFSTVPIREFADADGDYVCSTRVTGRAASGSATSSTVAEIELRLPPN